MTRFLLFATARLGALLWVGPLAGEENRNFVAVLGGLAILSGDAQTDFSQGALASSYAARAGAAFNLGVGRHFNDWISVQGNYIWNRNEVTLSAVAGNGFYAARNRSRQDQFVLDGMLYFRSLASRVRPYLSAGTGAIRLAREQVSIAVSPSGPAPPSAAASAWYPGLRVAVGADLKLWDGWAFRYSFSETLTPNLFSKGLTPPGSKNLMNFQHLFGIVKSF